MSGFSVFAYDPGVGTGWAWVCIGAKELKRNGAEGAIKVALDDRGLGTGSAVDVAFGDVRFRYGEVNTRGGDIETAQAVAIEAIVCSHMGNRVSRGRVPALTHVIGESFSFRERTKSRHMLSPIRVHAAVEAFLSLEIELMETEVSEQSPSEKSVITDERQKRWGLWFPGNKDANVAIKHLIVKLRALA